MLLKVRTIMYIFKRNASLVFSVELFGHFTLTIILLWKRIQTCVELTCHTVEAGLSTASSYAFIQMPMV